MGRSTYTIFIPHLNKPLITHHKNGYQYPEPLVPVGWVKIAREDFQKEMDTKLSGNASRATSKKFIIETDGQTIRLLVDKNLSISSLCAWIKTWSIGAKLITPGNKVINVDTEATKERDRYYVYFLHNIDSQAIKIGMTKNVIKRIKSMQTASPTQLKLIGTIPVEGLSKAKELEKNLHQKFSFTRKAGEWFEISDELQSYINTLKKA